MATAWQILFGLGIAFSLFVGYVIARFTKRRSSEIHSHHLLVLSAVINLLACCFVALLASVSCMVRTAISSKPDPLNFVLVLPFAVPGVAVVLAYTRGARRVQKKYALELAPRPLTRQVEELASRLGLHRIGVYTSDKIPTPFVFGQMGSPPSIVVPTRWELAGEEANVVLLHELSHILNKDTVFTTGAGFLIPRLKFLLLLALPLGLAVGLRAELAGLLAYLSLLYAYCAISFFVLFCTISRGREMLADITVAQFAGTSEASGFLLEADLKEALSVHTGFPHGEIGTGRFFRRAERWLNDKALFGKTRAFWGGVRRALTYLFSGKSERRVRTQDLLDTIRRTRTELVPTKESAFWIGWGVGTFLALLFVACEVWEKSVAWGDMGDAFGYLLHVGYALAFPLFMGTAFLFALPAWSEQGLGGFSRAYLSRLTLRYTYFLLGALPSFAIVQGFWLTPLERSVGVIAHAVLIAFVIVISGPIAVTSVAVYHTLPRRNPRIGAELLHAAGHLASVLAVVLLSVGLGCRALLRGNEATGLSLIAAMSAGAVGIILGTRGVISGGDRYVTASLLMANKMVRAELGWKSLVKNNSLYLAVVLTAGLPVGFAVYLLVSWLEQLIAGWALAIAFGTLLSAILVLLLVLSKGSHLSPVRRASTADLCSALSVLQEEPSHALREYTQAFKRGGETGLLHEQVTRRSGPLTLNHVHEMVCVFGLGGKDLAQKDAVVNWVLACEGGKGGFGIWPGSRPRLSMTYYALETLQCLGCLHAADRVKHARWIQGLRKDGVFRDPLARREPWEDTFFAIKSLALMGKLDFGNDDEILRTLESSLWQAVQRADMESVWYCVESLSLLGRNEKRPAVEELLRRTAFNLSIANPIYAARTIRSVVEAARIVFPSADDVAALFPEDFPERLMNAVEKELEPVVKRLWRKTAKKKS